MKKLSIFVLGAMLALTLTACSSKGGESAQPKTAPDGSPVQTETEAPDKGPDLNADPVQIITVYHKNDDGTGVKQELDGLDGEIITAEGLVDKLVEYGVLEEGTDVIDFTVNGTTGTLDLSQVPALSGTDEQIMLISIGNTFTENFELEQLKLLVEGDNYSGGSITQGEDDYLSYNSKYKTLGQ